VDLIAHYNHKFKEIRNLDGISNKEILTSLSITSNRSAVFRAGQGSGKSGSFFFFSVDQKFIIKTLSKKEMKTLFKMLDNLVLHLKSTDNESLLARIYGVFTLRSAEYS
jgi:1-phosphatidylinositol-4-phosphate 5-kinase